MRRQAAAADQPDALHARPSQAIDGQRQRGAQAQLAERVTHDRQELAGVGKQQAQGALTTGADAQADTDAIVGRQASSHQADLAAHQPQWRRLIELTPRLIMVRALEHGHGPSEIEQRLDLRGGQQQRQLLGWPLRPADELDTVARWVVKVIAFLASRAFPFANVSFGLNRPGLQCGIHFVVVLD